MVTGNTYNHDEVETPSPISTVVKILGDEVIAFDPHNRKRSRRITKSLAGVDDSVVVQAAATAALGGEMFIKQGPYNNSVYVMKTAINVPQNVVVRSDNARLDVTAVNTDLFVLLQERPILTEHGFRDCKFSTGSHPLVFRITNPVSAL
jgi:hypothetical protein